MILYFVNKNWMKLKATITVGVIVSSLVWASSFAADYPVQPANNGLAKKTIEWIFTDPGLQKNTTEEDRIVAAKAANEMSQLIIKSIKDLGIADDGFITDSEAVQLNTYMYEHYHDQMVKLHWDDERNLETGFHRVVNDGWEDLWYIPLKRHYKKANRISDGIFHLGLYPSVSTHKILNEDGNKNVRYRLIARGLYVLLKDDLNLKSWSKKAYYKPLIVQARQDKQAKIAELKAERAEKLAQAKDRTEYRAIKTEYREKIGQVRAYYNAKIAEYRSLMR